MCNYNTLSSSRIPQKYFQTNHRVYHTFPVIQRFVDQLRLRSGPIDRENIVSLHGITSARLGINFGHRERNRDSDHRTWERRRTKKASFAVNGKVNGEFKASHSLEAQTVETISIIHTQKKGSPCLREKPPWQIISQVTIRSRATFLSK